MVSRVKDLTPVMVNFQHSTVGLAAETLTIGSYNKIRPDHLAGLQSYARLIRVYIDCNNGTAKTHVCTSLYRCLVKHALIIRSMNTPDPTLSR